jgi:hypothetical protein
MRFVAQKGTNRICFSPHSTEKHSPPLGNPFLRSKYHFRSLGNTFLSPKSYFQSFKSPVRGKKMHSKGLLLSSSTGEEKKQCHLGKSSIAIYYQKPNK